MFSILILQTAKEGCCTNQTARNKIHLEPNRKREPMISPLPKKTIKSIYLALWMKKVPTASPPDFANQRIWVSATLNRKYKNKLGDD